MSAGQTPIRLDTSRVEFALDEFLSRLILKEDNKRALKRLLEPSDANNNLLHIVLNIFKRELENSRLPKFEKSNPRLVRQSLLLPNIETLMGLARKVAAQVLRDTNPPSVTMQTANTNRQHAPPTVAQPVPAISKPAETKQPVPIRIKAERLSPPLPHDAVPKTRLQHSEISSSRGSSEERDADCSSKFTASTFRPKRSASPPVNLTSPPAAPAPVLLGTLRDIWNAGDSSHIAPVSDSPPRVFPSGLLIEAELRDITNRGLQFPWIPSDTATTHAVGRVVPPDGSDTTLGIAYRTHFSKRHSAYFLRLRAADQWNLICIVKTPYIKGQFLPVIGYVGEGAFTRYPFALVDACSSDSGFNHLPTLMPPKPRAEPQTSGFMPINHQASPATNLAPTREKRDADQGEADSARKRLKTMNGVDSPASSGKPKASQTPASSSRPTENQTPASSQSKSARWCAAHNMEYPSYLYGQKDGDKERHISARRAFDRSSISDDPCRFCVAKGWDCWRAPTANRCAFCCVANHPAAACLGTDVKWESQPQSKTPQKKSNSGSASGTPYLMRSRTTPANYTDDDEAAYENDPLSGFTPTRQQPDVEQVAKDLMDSMGSALRPQPDVSTDKIAVAPSATGENESTTQSVTTQAGLSASTQQIPSETQQSTSTSTTIPAVSTAFELSATPVKPAKPADADISNKQRPPTIEPKTLFPAPTPHTEPINRETSKTEPAKPVQANPSTAPQPATDRAKMDDQEVIVISDSPVLATVNPQTVPGTASHATQTPRPSDIAAAYAQMAASAQARPTIAQPPNATQTQQVRPLQQTQAIYRQRASKYDVRDPVGQIARSAELTHAQRQQMLYSQFQARSAQPARQVPGPYYVVPMSGQNPPNLTQSAPGVPLASGTQGVGQPQRPPSLVNTHNLPTFPGRRLSQVQPNSAGHASPALAAGGQFPPGMAGSVTTGQPSLHYLNTSGLPTPPMRETSRTPSSISVPNAHIAADTSGSTREQVSAVSSTSSPAPTTGPREISFLISTYRATESAEEMFIERSEADLHDYLSFSKGVEQAFFADNEEEKAKGATIPRFKMTWEGNKLPRVIHWLNESEYDRVLSRIRQTPGQGILDVEVTPFVEYKK